jgi:hypothetical protein
VHPRPLEDVLDLLRGSRQNPDDHQSVTLRHLQKIIQK